MRKPFDCPVRIHLVRGRTHIGWLQMTMWQWQRILESLE